MPAEREMRDFTRALFRDSPDLSALTLAVVRRRYLAHVGREMLQREEKELLKRVVEEELLMMQREDSGAEGGAPPGHATPAARAQKRGPSSSSPAGGAPEDTARKKPRQAQDSEADATVEGCGINPQKPAAGQDGWAGAWVGQADSGAEEPPEQGSIDGLGSASDSEMEAGVPPPPRGGLKQGREAGKGRGVAEQWLGRPKAASSSASEGRSEAEGREESGGEAEERQRKVKARREGDWKSRKPAEEKGRPAAKDSSSEAEEGQPRSKAEEKDLGSEGEKEEQTRQVRKRCSSETDEDSSSSSSSSSAQQEKPSPGTKHKKGKAPGQAGAAREHPSVRRLKRYILACGVRRNYKKLLAGCSSTKQQVQVLRQELEAIGLHGNPSLERCRALRQRREEAAEVAALDVGNIIACEGRPRRHSAWSLYSSPQAPVPCQSPPTWRPVDWSSLRGVISSDGESD
ncbi:HIRA-interacting protein 3 [Carettochelys insculpta]|uniref:HIRA-interacting protein 3 n=1 Tax=Carettochelys insculpta TaxID=44489 RepID=UPI003EBD7811